MIFYFLSHCGDVPFYLINFDGIFGLFFCEGAEEFGQEIPNFGLYLIPFELFDCEFLYLLSSSWATHFNFIIYTYKYPSELLLDG